MKALRYYGIHNLKVEDIPMPSLQAGHVLIKVSYSGICGSDLHIYNKGFFVENVPSTMGHEFSGVIVDAAADVTGFKIGDAVVGNPMVPCGQCQSCRDGYFNTCDNLGFIGEVREGCFAQYIVLPESVLVKVPNGANLKAAALAEPLAVVMNVLDKAKLQPDTKIAIIGAGPIGLLTAMAAKSIAKVTDITIVNRSEGRREIAKSAGIDKAVSQLNDDEYFDVIIDTAGKEQSLLSAVNHTKAGGNIYVVSIFEDDFPSPINTIVGRELTITGCNAYTQEHIVIALETIAANEINVEPVITGVFSLDDGLDAFDIISRPGPSHCKLLFKNNEEEE